MSHLFLRRIVRTVLAASGAAMLLPAAFQTAVAAPGRVCLDPTQTLAACTAGTVGTYYANSELPKVDAATGAVSGGIRKFVDTLPGLTSAGKNTFANGGLAGEYITVAEPDTVSFPGNNYYVIGVIEHAQWMHSDLPKATLQRSYVQLYPKLSERPAALGTANPPTPPASAYAALGAPAIGAPVALTRNDGTPLYWPGTTEQVYAYDKPHYLGPIIITTSGTAVRTKFVNFLPTGGATVTVVNGTKTVTARNGDMFMPVDESLPGAGESPGTVTAGAFAVGGTYTIGTVGTTNFTAIGALSNLSGTTFTATGAGSGTGTATPKYSQNRVGFHLHGGDSPWISDGTPHQWIAAVGDPTPFKKGKTVMSAPDATDPGDGAEMTFWPNDQSSRLMWYHDHTFGLTRQNAYSGAAAGYVIIDAAELALQNGGTVGGQQIAKALPGALLEQLVLVIQDKTFVPSDIATQDAKWDTNAWGKPGDLWYPHVYEPNQIWAPNTPKGTDAALATANPAGRWDYAVDDFGGYLPPNAPMRTDADYGQVAFPDGTYFGGPSATPESYMDTPLVNGVAYPVLNVQPKAYRVRFLNGANDRYWNLSLWVADPNAPTADGRSLTEVPMVAAPDGRPGGIPDPAAKGPNIIQFANEGGLLPTPVVYTPKAMTGTVDPVTGDFTLARGPGDFYFGGAERADTVIDFSQYAGKTLIMYNDSSAPVPGGDPRYDYYTGDPDWTPYGGAPTTLPGFGPNTRTVMQIRVAASAAAPAYDPNGTGGPLATELPKAYAVSTDVHVSPVATDYDPATGLVSLADGSTVKPEVKTIQGFTDPNFGRLIAQLGEELPDATGTLVATPLAYVDKPTDIVNADQVTYWVIKNNDMDNHPMHFHLFNVQVLGRFDTVTQAFVPPQADEQGWKETVKNWPQEDVIVALKAKTPQLPFGLPKSVRLLDPTLPANATTAVSPRPGVDTQFAFSQFDVNTGVAAPVANVQQDYDWEYVWHCHILGHEENDLMRPMVFHPNIAAPAAPSGVAVSAAGKVSWTDPTPAATAKGNPRNEFGFRVERAALSSGVPGAFVALAAAPGIGDARVNTLANATSFQDAPAATTDYQYRVVSVNEAGSAVSAAATLAHAPAAPTGLAATKVPVAATNSVSIALFWTDVATNETSYTVKRDGVVIATLPANSTGYTDSIACMTTAAANTAHTYIVSAVNAVGTAPSASLVVTPGVLIAQPTAFATTLAAGAKSVTLSWTDQSVGETGYAVLRATAGINASTGAVTYAPAVRLPKATSVLAANLATYVDTSIGANAVYRYEVGAVNGTTVGPVALAFTATATSITGATGLTSGGAATTSSIALQWQQSTNALVTGYQIQRCVALTTSGCTAAAGTWTSLPMVAGRTTQKFTDAGLATKTSYAYRISAVSTATPTPLASTWTAPVTLKTK